MEFKKCEAEDEEETVLSDAVGGKLYQDNTIMYVGGIPGERFSLENPRDAMTPVVAGLTDLALHSLVWRNEVRMLVAKITSKGGTPSSSSKYGLLGVPRRPREGWPVLADNVTLEYPAGTEAASDLRGLVQVKDWNYGIDYDSRKILILGANELNGLFNVSHTLEIEPYDLSAEAELPADAKGWAIAALRDEATDTDYVFALYNQPTTSSATAYTDSILVKMKVNKDDGTLEVVETLTLTGVLNAQGLAPVIADDGSLAFIIPAIGGMQQGGATNQMNSVLAKVTNLFGDAATPATPMAVDKVLTGDPTSTPTPPRPTWDIAGFTAALRKGGVAYIRASKYNEGWTSDNFTYYKTTVSKLLNLTASKTLWNAYVDGTLEIAEEGAVTSSNFIEAGGVTSPAPCGIYFHDLLIAMGDEPEDDEIFVFQGSAFKVCDALHYDARSLGFGLGNDDGQIGGYDVNSVDATWESERQIRNGMHYKHGIRPVRRSGPPAGTGTSEESK
jgi:hypothetical protein